MSRLRNLRLTTWLIVGQIVTLILALTAGALAVYGLTSNINRISASRVEGRHDSCQLIKGIALSAATAETRGKVILFIDGTPLRNCNAYARTDNK